MHRLRDSKDVGGIAGESGREAGGRGGWADGMRCRVGVCGDVGETEGQRDGQVGPGDVHEE